MKRFGNSAKFVHDDDVTPVVTSFWVTGEPSSIDQKCVTTGRMSWDNMFGWDDQYCEYSYTFICEFIP